MAQRQRVSGLQFSCSALGFLAGALRPPGRITGIFIDIEIRVGHTERVLVVLGPRWAICLLSDYLLIIPLTTPRRTRQTPAPVRAREVTAVRGPAEARSSRTSGRSSTRRGLSRSTGAPASSSASWRPADTPGERREEREIEGNVTSSSQ